MSLETHHVRKPWVASSLSLVCTGLGQIYCGRAGRGLVMYSSSLLLGLVMVVTALFAHWTAMLFAFLLSLGGLIGLLIWSVRDARRTARSLAATDFQPQEYNRPLVYSMMALTNVPYLLGLVFLVRATMFEAFIIPTGSMAPTFGPGDRILVTKLGLSAQTFQRGDVVVFRNPINRQQTFVKRVIGLPGETVAINNGQVFIDGRPLPQAPLQKDEPGAVPGSAGGQTYWERAGDKAYQIHFDHPESRASVAPITVAPDAYFVLGDHRDRSLDSREVGNVPHGLMVGLVRCIYFPGDTWQRFGAVK